MRLGKYLRPGDEPTTEIYPLDGAQARLLLDTAERSFGRWFPWLLCALRTGMRLGELLALQGGDIDWNERFIVVQRNIVRGVVTSPKSHQRRQVDMTLQLSQVLFAWRRIQRIRWRGNARVGVFVADGNAGGGAQRAPCLQSHPRQSRVAPH